MGWIAGLGAVAGGLISANSSANAAKGMQYRPWNSNMAGVGGVQMRNNMISYTPDMRMQNATNPLMYGALNQYQQGQQNSLGQDFLRNIYGQAQGESVGQLGSLQDSAASITPYQGQNFMSNLNGGMLGSFDPNQAGSNYTNMLRQQALPQEQQATASAMTGLFNKGRLGTTGGMNAMGELQNQQQQSDLGRQIAGQQYGLQSQLQSQQGYDQARMNQQGMMMNNFNTNQQGMMNQFGMDQGMFQRNLDLYTNSSTATQDRFQRALQLFGGENALNQQNLNDFTGLLGAQQSQQQTLMDQARIAASVGSAQTSANSNAAQIRNQGNQDLIAGFLGAANAYAGSKK